MVSLTAYHKGKYLRREEISKRLSECPVCNSTDIHIVYVLQKDPDIFLEKCRYCCTVFADAMPTASCLDEYYAHYYDDNQKGNTSGGPERIAQRIYPQCKSKPKLRILDFGGGNGEVAFELAKMLCCKGGMIEVSVVDYNIATVRSDHSKIKMSHHSTLATCEGVYDIVIASAVIEHIPDMKSVLETLSEKVAPSGVFYARTPYCLPIIKVMKLIGISMDFTYPGHIYDLGDDFWKATKRSFFPKESFSFIYSRPSPVESTFRDAPVRTAVAAAMKAIWYLTGGVWALVGGWEVMIRRIT